MKNQLKIFGFLYECALRQVTATAQGRTRASLCLFALFVACTQAARAQTEAVLFSFSVASDPNAELVLDAKGNLYGTTHTAGTKNRGSVYQLTPTGTLNVLYSFKGDPDGFYPCSGLIGDGQGNLYGTTESGGGHVRGAVFELSADGKEKVLYGFDGPPDGDTPCGLLARDAQGHLYGTNLYGGNHPRAHGSGTVFRITPDGTETVLYTFTGGADGANSFAGLVRDAKGNLYGTAYKGGANGFGNVFKVTPAGVETVLYNFTGGTDGAHPTGALVRDGKGNLYGTAGGGAKACVNGTACGVVFKVTRTGVETVLYTFTSEADGYGPNSLVRDAKGNLYGTTGFGGTFNAGTVFKLMPDGTKMTLYNFAGGTDGNGAQGLLRDKPGNLYGTTVGGGANNGGTVFKVVP